MPKKPVEPVKSIFPSSFLIDFFNNLESLLDIKETLVDYSKRIEDKKELDKLEIALSELLSIDEQFLRVLPDIEIDNILELSQLLL